jgi:hypothetical protein
MASRQPSSPLDREQMLGLVSILNLPLSSQSPITDLVNAPLQRGIRQFLKVRTSYDVLPLSCRLIVFDNELLIRKSLNILLQNGEPVCSAP